MWFFLSRLSRWGLLSTCICWSAAVSAVADPLLDMDLEALMDLEVTSVSKRVQPLADSAAAIYVITSDEIRRSGATALADVFRLAPGVDVAKLNASTWAVSIRGLNSKYSHNLLVLVDGRSIYSPLYGGVYWDAAMPMLEDIERIEVIRGPGASLWGVNAVNGVINVITKSAELTQGYRVVAAAGNEESHARLRAGGKTNNLFYRGYAVHRNVDDGTDKNSGGAAGDAYSGTQIGARADWFSGRERFTLQSDVSVVDKNYNHNISDYLGGAKYQYENHNANVLANWLQPWGDDDELQLKVYYDYTKRDEPGYVYKIDTFDIDLQFNHARQNDHRLTWGLNTRYFDDEVDGSQIFSMTDQAKSWHLLSGFVQDEYAWTDKLTLVAGLKAEKVEGVATAWQPTLRFNYRKNDQVSYWGSVSRAERIPTRQDLYSIFRGEYPSYLRDGVFEQSYDLLVEEFGLQDNALLRALFDQIEVPDDFLLIGLVTGNESLKSEKTISYELGTRWQPRENAFIDVAAFYSEYTDMRALQFIDWEPVPGGVQTELQAVTLGEAVSHGFELAVEYRPSPSWRYKLNYNYLEFNVKRDNFLNAVTFLEGVSPDKQLSFRTYWDINDRYQFDVDFYYVGDIESGRETSPDEYADVNLRLAWQVAPQISLAVMVRNLFHAHRYEYQERLIGPVQTEIDRSVFLQLDWKQ